MCICNLKNLWTILTNINFVQSNLFGYPFVLLLITDGDWSIQVATLESLDEQADVALVVYGDLGTSGSILLGAPPGKKIFTTGNNDEFRVSVYKYLESLG